MSRKARKALTTQAGVPVEVKKAVSALRQSLRKGSVNFAELANLPALEMLVGSTLTFIPLTEWLDFPWPDFCPASEWEKNAMEAALREMNILYGMWLVWRAHFVRAAAALSHEGKKLKVRLPSGQTVGKTLVEELGRTELPPKEKLFVTSALQRDPVTGDWACVTCMVHDREGAGYAAAVGWNAAVTDFQATVEELRKWAQEFVPSVEMYSVWEDPENLRPFPLGVSQDTLITLPYIVIRSEGAARPAKRGVVIPFPGEKARVEKR
ncbi:hypothetical protein SAMN00808754_1480 [Thermanaeromonas toyohensis ToBE]|uniref:Uncharacterized protein n=1 Tax=Thermanaeromonas toyohensis ToBE TaxID=698762 RepID=A0A1W1VT11_9FIRM|nr:hypothetical protein [Thermanaeromonas toyohensis]SMB96413.1 hypothetical protein SAMN00808754_1480 [Thermanaeromonas toyohensis ToBE]